MEEEQKKGKETSSGVTITEVTGPIPKPAEEQPEQKAQEEKSTAENEEEIDFSKLKEKTKKIFSKTKKEKPKKEESEFTFQNSVSFAKKNSKWLLPVVFILIAIIISTSLRMAPSDLPITDQWAENTIHNLYRNHITQQINQQYPNLPAHSRESIVDKEFQKFFSENKEQISAETKQMSENFKAQLQDENGDTYLLAIDPYLWFSQARNVVNHGHLGDKIIDGESYFSLRDGRLDKKASIQFHPYFGAYLYKFLSTFNKNISLMRALFLLPAIIIGLSLIPTFFIGRRVAGDIGGFFAATILAVNGVLLTRTPAGFADTDPYNVFFPLLIIWIFIESYFGESLKKQIGLSALAGFLLGVYAGTWSGWSPVLLFII